ncbi:hypothetical protein LT493_06815 [Streptomyces tricolor]|nr:hypothetical protein [Streptomyces tricolor]
MAEGLLDDRVAPTGLEAQIQKARQGEQDAVRTWLRQHPGLIDAWAPVAAEDAGSRAAGVS